MKHYRMLKNDHKNLKDALEHKGTQWGSRSKERGRLRDAHGHGTKTLFSLYSKQLIYNKIIKKKDLYHI